VNINPETLKASLDIFVGFFSVADQDKDNVINTI
jgi:hypothetical protein